jgi:photosystem II stability/assembly factor-like uncharacterized protein
MIYSNERKDCMKATAVIMRQYRIRMILFLFMMLSIVQPSQAQWQQTNGPYGGEVRSIVSQNNYLYAGVVALGGGVYRSSNGGATWEKMNNGLSDKTINILATAGQYVYAGTDGNGVYRSVDQGKSWESINSGLPSVSKVYAIASDGIFLYIGTSDGVYRSMDQGTSWSRVSNGLQQLDIRSLVIRGTTVYAGTYGGGIYRSVNNGDTWILSGLSQEYVMAMISVGSDIMIGSYGIHRSTDNGNTWLPSGLAQKFLYTFATQGSMIFAGTNEGVYRSTDNGITWSLMTGLGNRVCKALHSYRGAIYSGTITGGYLSDDNGVLWSQMKVGFPYVYTLGVYTPTITPTLYCGTYGMGVYNSTDNGQNWYPVRENKDLTNLYVLSLAFSDDGMIYCGTYGGGVYRTNLSSGTSWLQVNSNLSNLNVWSVYTAGTKYVYACTEQGLFRSTNSGDTWTSLGLMNEHIQAIVEYEGRIYVGTRSSGIYSSSDDGKTWSQKINGLTALRVTSINVIWGILYVGTNGGGVFSTTDKGESWFPMNEGLGSNNVVQTVISDGQSLYVGTYSGIYKRKYGGDSWEPIGLPENKVYSIVISPSMIIAGTEQGVWWRLPIESSASELVSPPDQATDIELTPEFRWTHEPGIDKYALWVYPDRTNPTSNRVVKEIVSAQDNLVGEEIVFRVTAPLQSEKTYYWQVRKNDDVGDVIGERSFTTGKAAVPKIITVEVVDKLGNKNKFYAVGDTIHIKYDEQYHSVPVSIDLITKENKVFPIEEGFIISGASDKYKEYVFSDSCSDCTIRVKVQTTRPKLLYNFKDAITSIDWNNQDRLLITTKNEAKKAGADFSVYSILRNGTDEKTYRFTMQKDSGFNKGTSFYGNNSCFINDNLFMTAATHNFSVNAMKDYHTSYCLIRDIHATQEGKSDDNSRITQMLNSNNIPVLRGDVYNENNIVLISARDTIRSINYTYNSSAKSCEVNEKGKKYVASMNLSDIQYSKNGTYIAAMGANFSGKREINFYNNNTLGSFNTKLTLDNNQGIHNAFAWLSDSKIVVNTISNNQNQLWLYSIQNQLPNKVNIEYEVAGIDCSKDGNYIAITGKDGKLRIYDNNLSIKKEFEKTSESLTSVAFDKTGNHIAFGDVSGNIFIVNNFTTAIGNTVEGKSDPFTVEYPNITIQDPSLQSDSTIIIKAKISDKTNNVNLRIQKIGEVRAIIRKPRGPKNPFTLVITNSWDVYKDIELKNNSQSIESTIGFNIEGLEKNKEYTDSIVLELHSKKKVIIKLKGTIESSGPSLATSTSEITLSPTVCTEVNDSFILENKGDESVTINSIEFEKPSCSLLVTALPFTIGADSSQTVNFSFDPSKYNNGDITCTIHHTAPGGSMKITIKPEKQTIVLSASAMTVADTLYPGEPKNIDIEILNEGTYKNFQLKFTKDDDIEVPQDAQPIGKSSITINSSDTGRFTRQITFSPTECPNSNTGDRSIDITYVVGKATLDTPTIEEFSTTVKTPLSRQISLKNSGNRATDITLKLQGDTDVWSINDTKLHLKGGAAKSISIEFTPEEEKEYSAKLEYSYHDGKNVVTESIDLKGRGGNPSLSIAPIAFGEQLRGKESQGRRLQIVNKSEKEITMQGLSLRNGLVFKLKNVSSPLRIGSGQTDSSVSVFFTPKEVKDYSDTIEATIMGGGRVIGRLSGTGRDKDENKDIQITVTLQSKRGTIQELRPKDRISVSINVLGSELNKAIDASGLESIDYSIGLSWQPTHLYLLPQGEAVPGIVSDMGTLRKGVDGFRELATFDFEVLWGSTEERGSIVFDKAEIDTKQMSTSKIVWLLTQGIDYQYNPYCLDSLIVRGGIYRSGPIRAYPNPSGGVVRIELEEGFDTTEGYEIEIYDMYGRSVGEYVLQLKSTDIDMSDFPIGHYRIELRDKTNRQISAPSIITIMR